MRIWRSISDKQLNQLGRYILGWLATLVAVVLLAIFAS